MSGKYRVPTEAEVRLLIRNGIDPGAVVVAHRSEGSVVLLNHHTRDSIHITMGDKKWEKDLEGGISE